jgi:hypothetical protein
MNVYWSLTRMQMDAKYKAVKQGRCMTRVITALASPINNPISAFSAVCRLTLPGRVRKLSRRERKTGGPGYRG